MQILIFSILLAALLRLKPYKPLNKPQKIMCHITNLKLTRNRVKRVLPALRCHSLTLANTQKTYILSVIQVNTYTQNLLSKIQERYITDNSRLRIGKNCIMNKLSCMINKIDFDWLNQSFYSFKIKFKLTFLALHNGGHANILMQIYFLKCNMLQWKLNVKMKGKQRTVCIKNFELFLEYYRWKDQINTFWNWNWKSNLILALLPGG